MKYLLFVLLLVTVGIVVSASLSEKLDKHK